MTSTEEFSRGEGFDDFDALELRQFNVPNGPTWHPNTWKLNKPGKEEKKTKAADRGAKRPRDIVADSLEERQFTKPDGTIWYGNDFPPKKGEKKGAAGADNRPRRIMQLTDFKYSSLSIARSHRPSPTPRNQRRRSVPGNSMSGRSIPLRGPWKSTTTSFNCQ